MEQKGTFDMARDLRFDVVDFEQIADADWVHVPSNGPQLIVLDGVAAFTDGGPSRGELKAANVMIAGTDRVAVDAVGLAMLKSLGSNEAIMGRRIFEQEQMARAVELGLGVSGPDCIEIVTAGAEGGAVADRLRAILAQG